MEKKTLINYLHEYFVSATEQMELIIYGQLKESNEVFKFDIAKKELPALIDLFILAIKEVLYKKLQDNDFSLLPISTADERRKCLYLYDLELPVEIKQLKDIAIAEDIKKFNFKDNSLSDIDSLIVVLANGKEVIAMHKKLSTIEVIGQGGYILKYVKDKHRMDRFDDQMLRISPKFQIINILDEVIIIDLATLEKSFGFHDVIKREATIGLRAISNMEIVSDMNALYELLDDVTFARKLTKISRDSPVIKFKISNKDIIEFSKKHPATSEMKYSENDKKFNLTSKKLKNLFVRLLNDDLLTSELTQLHYASIAKDKFDSEIEKRLQEDNN
jgi:hypothetical protein